MQTLIRPTNHSSNTNMSNKVTITLPDELVARIDKERGDVPRSRFILRLIEKANSGVNRR